MYIYDPIYMLCVSIFPQSLEDDVVHDVLPEAVEDGLDRNGPDSRRKKNPVGCSRSLWAMYQQAVSERWQKK